jgi:hypothetical protein
MTKAPISFPVIGRNAGDYSSVVVVSLLIAQFHQRERPHLSAPNGDSYSPAAGIPQGPRIAYFNPHLLPMPRPARTWTCSACGETVLNEPMMVLKHQMSHARRRPFAGGRPMPDRGEEAGEGDSA